MNRDISAIPKKFSASNGHEIPPEKVKVEYESYGNFTY
jgi:hypothetical protein